MNFRNFKKRQIPLSNRYEVFNKLSLKPIRPIPKKEVVSSLEIDNLIDYIYTAVYYIQNRTNYRK
jgi:hypothetical protein